jgi:phosphoribosylanthranilate isomerase
MNTSHNAQKVKIKICGITLAEQALFLDRAGVDFIGFNFWPHSKRFIPPEQAASIISSLKTARAVGIFVDEDIARLRETITTTGIHYAQLHGSEDSAYINRVPVPVIKALPSHILKKAPFCPPAGAGHLLFDTQEKAQFGATGKAFDWQLLHNYQGPPFFLAGGLGPGNLKEALAHCTPYAVDLNSRVEVSPGVKDLEIIRECMAIVENSTD